MNAQTTIIDALAAYRLTRLVTKDVLLDELRDDIIRGAYARRGDGRQPPAQLNWTDMAMHDPDAPKLATLITCRWCAGMWISLGVVAARRVAPGLWGPLARALAFSAGAALISRLETDR